MSAPERYLIVKRGLYYRPASLGYTGLKDEAGRYSLDDVAALFPNRDSPNQDGMEFINEADAPDYSPACPWDTRLVHRTRQEERAHVATLIAQARAEALEEAAVIADPYDPEARGDPGPVEKALKRIAAAIRARKDTQ